MTREQWILLCERDGKCDLAYPEAFAAAEDRRALIGVVRELVKHAAHLSSAGDFPSMCPACDKARGFLATFEDRS